MRCTKIFRLRVRSLFRRSQVERELGDELEYHLERLVQDYSSAGMSAEAARDAALREMGAIEPRKEECRDARGVGLIDSVRQDIAYAVRGLKKSPSFAIVATVSLALGIGANAAIFSLWNGLLHASLPAVEKPHELVMLSNPDDSGSWTGRVSGVRSWLTYAEFEEIRDQARSFAGVFASQSSLGDWVVRVDHGGFEPARGRLVSGGYFDVLGVRPIIGRAFTAADDYGEPSHVVLSYPYWQQRFGGRPEVLGDFLTVNSVALTIIGVGPPGFIGETNGQQPDFWMPLRLQPRLMPPVNRLHDQGPDKSMWLHVFGRLEPGVSHAQAEAESNAIFLAGLESFYGAAAAGERRRDLLDQRLDLRSAARGASAERVMFSQSLTGLLVAVGVLLLIACANLANLLLARGMARGPEMALRASLGAGRARLIRQLLTESLLLAVIGGAIGAAVALPAHGALVRMLARSDSDFAMSFSIDAAVVGVLVLATLVAALLCGGVPAWQVTRDSGHHLKEQGRSVIGKAGQQRSGRVLVSLQLALSLPLLVGAGLLARTVHNLQHADLGFSAERLLQIRVDLREAATDISRRDVLLGEILAGLRQVPGVRSASFSQLGLFTGGQSSSTIRIEGYAPNGDGNVESGMDVAGPEYFSTLGVPVTLGRAITENDRVAGAKVSVVNEAFASRFLQGRHPIGLRLTMGSSDARTSYEIIGVAGNAHTQDLRGDVAPRFFLPGRDRGASAYSPFLLVRTSTASASVLSAVRTRIEELNRDVAIRSATTIEEQMAPLIAQDRTIAQLAVVFGVVALGLAAIGLYGLLAYEVARRTGEIAVRLALGARPAGVLAMILQETIALVGTGLAAGAAFAYGASRLIDSRLYGVKPQDPLTLALATALLLLVALGATYVPARRASNLDPMTALRQG